MAEKPNPGTQWRHTSVVLREDIFDEALRLGLDISDECNRALADLMGIDYRQQQLQEAAVPQPVIIADAGGTGSRQLKKEDLPAVSPVINADDPRAAHTVKREKVQKVTRGRETAPVPEPAASPAPDAPAQKGGRVPSRKQKREAPPAGKKKREDAIRKFIAEKLSRTDQPDAFITKDEVYSAFSRWCRDHRITPVPDRRSVSVALKNRYAFTEKTIDGISVWIHVRLR
jgi:hypothetical protein